MRRKLLIFFIYTLTLGAALSLSACNGLFNGIYDGSAELNTEIKPGSFSQVNTTDYAEWVYINLKTLQAKAVKIGEEYESEIPAEWHIAIHRYDIKTNEGAGYETSYTTFEELKAAGALPGENAFVKDEWTTGKIAVDMSGMMDGKIVYADSYRNSVLSRWLDVDLSTMPPIYKLSGKVYLLMLKDKSVAALRFTNYMNGKGAKGYIDFKYIYPYE